MRAVQVTGFGDPEVLVPAELPDPVAGPDQVVVDVSVADTLFVETQIRQGLHREFFRVQPPYVPGGAVAGWVRSVGPGVNEAWVGRPVATRTADNGGYAAQAAALLHDGLTATALLEPAPVRPDGWALVTGAAGGMGVLLVQLLAAAGARVVAAARGARKLDLVRSLGAEVVVDYSEPGWATRVLETTSEVEVVLDGAGGQVGRDAFGITARGGWFSAHGAASGGFASVDPGEAAAAGVMLRGIQHVQLEPDEAQQLTGLAFESAVAGRMKPVIGQTFPLDRAADAHAAIESRAVVGKTLLVV